MIKNSEFLQVCLYSLAQINPKDKLVFKTLKKDREIEVKKLENQRYSVQERGFCNEIFENVDLKELKKLLKILQKREFPRSHQLWFKIVSFQG